MTSKWDVVAGIKKSGLLPSDRIIMMMLVDVADAETAIVPEQWTPSLTELAEWTGLGRSTVAARLKELERLGWIKRVRPAVADAIGRGCRTCYQLAIGEAVEKTRPARPANPTRHDPIAEPGQELDQVTTDSPATELVQPLDEGSPTAGLPLVQPLDRTSPTAGHKNHPPTEGGSPTSSHQDPPSTPGSPPPADDAATLPGFESTEQPPKKPKRKRAKSETTAAPAPEDFPITPEMRAYAAEKCPDVKDLEHQTEQFLLHHGAKGSKFKNWVMAWQKWMRNQQEWTPVGRARGAPRRDWRDVSGQDHSAWTNRPDPRDVSTPEAIETGWNRKGTTQ